MKRFDMHVHSRFSFDNDSDPEATIKVAIEKGLDGLAFTDHDAFMPRNIFNTLKNKYKKYITILRGIEVTTHMSHTLVYGLTTDDILSITLDDSSSESKYVVSVADCVKVASYLDGIAVPAHPFRWGMGEGLTDVPNVFCLEGINGASTLRENKNAIKLASQMKIGCIAGSDSHQPNTVGRVFTEFEEDEINDETIVDVIKRGKFSVKMTDQYLKAWENFYSTYPEMKVTPAERAVLSRKIVF